MKIGVAALAMLIVALVQGCSGLDMVNAVAPDGGVVETPGIAYGAHRRQTLDLYKPANVSGRLPTVLFLYGGSWKRGHKEDYAFAGRALARAGFLVAVADYRVYPETIFPGFVEDGAKAVRWLTEHADEHGGKTTGIHLMGHSAGAHIAAMIALDAAYLKAEGLSQDVLGRWVGLAGPYAFYPSKIDYVGAIFQHLDDENTARPITFVNAKSPPALLLHGADDTTVMPRNSRALASALNTVGVPAVARFYDGIGHARLVLSLSDPFTGFAPVLFDSVRFLKTGAFPETRTADRS
ncbi:MAG: alpha/beta hydrolase [Rhodospirillales bacterium]|nr:alpha/beta hydrolase [Rhodospirillales bacterium]MBO6788203.1 alpha/beta hydrolase [Rhodospirillales bacterium]